LLIVVTKSWAIVRNLISALELARPWMHRLKLLSWDRIRPWYVWW
jgi:hypothetical protein